MSTIPRVRTQPIRICPGSARRPSPDTSASGHQPYTRSRARLHGDRASNLPTPAVLDFTQSLSVTNKPQLQAWSAVEYSYYDLTRFLRRDSKAGTMLECDVRG